MEDIGGDYFAPKDLLMMIKYWIRAIFTSLALLVTATMASAQEYSFTPVSEPKHKIRTEWGVGIGAFYTGMSMVSTENVSLKTRFGFEGHFDIGVIFGKHFALETEVSYQGGSIDVSNGHEEHRVRTKGVDIPLFASLRLANNRVRISAGPLFTVMSRGEYTSNSETMMYGPVNSTWNVAASVGVTIARYFIIEARYIHSLKDELNHFCGEEFATRTYRVAAGITVLF
ncbi:MAG: PorT family protein [Alistipes sp.]|nr:PorT family protein [Alistipes sp.]